LMPRLAAFIGQENHVPYDYHELLAMIAPRPVLVVAPTLDDENNLDDITRCVGEAAKVYEWLGAKNKLQLYSPDDYNRFSPELQQVVIQRLAQMAALPGS
ncbi:MAG: alpha/beta hydrolase, partial [Candidatus Omnitrophica bacterium]|nr:alpha/beta hydrolase [Candidatus Omnitrophota bacterium]